MYNVAFVTKFRWESGFLGEVFHGAPPPGTNWWEIPGHLLELRLLWSVMFTATFNLVTSVGTTVMFGPLKDENLTNGLI